MTPRGPARARAWAALALQVAGFGCGAGPLPPAPLDLRPETAAAAAAAADLAPLLEALYGCPVAVAAPAALALPSRAAGGVDADAALVQLAGLRAADTAALVALVEVPLHEGPGPSAPAVFGMGSTAGRSAVCSIAAIAAATPAAPDAPARARARLARVLLHETGHALGLAHCDDPACLMRPSDALAELDATALAPCATCWRRFCAARHLAADARREALDVAARARGIATAPLPAAAGGRG